MAQTRNCLARIAKTKPTTIFQSFADQRSAPDAHCAVPVEADGVAYPTSELLAVVLSLSAVVVYIVAVLAFIAFWFS